MKMFVLLIAMFSAISLYGQKKDYVSFEAYPTKTEVKAGETFEIQLLVSNVGKWYFYSTEMQLNDEGIGPTETYIGFDDEQIVELEGDLRAPSEAVKYDDGFEMDVKYFGGKVSIILKVKAKQDINLAEDKILVNFYAQFCDNKKCMPPEDFFVPVKNTIVENPQPLMAITKGN